MPISVRVIINAMHRVAEIELARARYAPDKRGLSSVMVILGKDAATTKELTGVS